MTYLVLSSFNMRLVQLRFGMPQVSVPRFWEILMLLSGLTMKQSFPETPLGITRNPPPMPRLFPIGLGPAECDDVAAARALSVGGLARHFPAIGSSPLVLFEWTPE